MRLLPILFLVACCLSCHAPGNSGRAPPKSDSGTNFVGLAVCEFEGKVYFFEATAEVLATTPKWNAATDFPPLSPRRAEAVAIAEARRLCPDVPGWKPDNIALRQLDGDFWYYAVSLYSAGLVIGRPHVLEVPVLMNGEAVHGTTEQKWKPKE